MTSSNDFVLPAREPASLRVAGLSARFPVNRIFCVGRNYAAHAREMGKDPSRDPPFFFMKPGTAAVDASPTGVTIPYPPHTANYQHEVELVVAIGRSGAAVPVARALDLVYGYAVGLDMTRRDLQLAARESGRPWEFGKSFAHSAPIGAIHRVGDVGHIDRGPIEVTVDGAVRQRSDVSLLIWSVAECVSVLSEYDALEPGDLIMTGTPEGVGPVSPGQSMHAVIGGLSPIAVTVGTQAGAR